MSFSKLIVTVFALSLIYIFSVKKCDKADYLIQMFVEKYMDIILAGVVLFLACYVRVKLLDYESGDYLYFLKQWYMHLKNQGGIAGLKDEIGNYTEGYMLFLALLTYLPVRDLYGIKLFSIIFELLTALLIRKAVCDYLKVHNKKLISNICFSFVLLAPTIVFNSAYWGQCDSIYTFFIICSIYCYWKEEWNFVFVCIGCAFAFKLQVIFILPVFFVLYVKDKRFSILKFGLIPVTYFVWSLPAFFAGKPLGKIVDLLFSYGTGTTEGLTASFNNLYTLVLSNNAHVNKYIYIVGVTLTLALTASSMAVFVKIRWQVNLYSLITISLYFVLLITYFLPGMHERYLYTGDVLCIIWWVLNRKQKLWYVPAGILMFSLLNYMRYITDVWPGSEWNILTEINGLVSVVYFFFLVKTLILLCQELKGNVLIGA